MISAHIFDKIQVLVRKAKVLPFYCDLYSKIEELHDISEIPFLKEEHIKNNIMHDMHDKACPICVYFTSGTTAEPKAFYREPHEMDYIIDYIKTLCEIEGMKGGERVAILLGQSFWGAGYFTTEGHVKAGNIVTAIDMGLSKETIVQLVKAFQPTVISSVPSLLLNLKDDLKGLKLKTLETTGELLDNQTRKTLEESYGAEVFDAYGLTEGIIGTECQKHDGYHFLPDKVFLEIINPDSEEILPEENWGELVMTVLNDALTPIIRYRTNDICKISFKKCSCGFDSPRIWIKGRQGKMLMLIDGAKVSQLEIEFALKKLYGDTATFDIHVNNAANISIIEIAVNGGDAEKDHFAESCIASLNYETIYLMNSGKLKVVINHK